MYDLDIALEERRLRDVGGGDRVHRGVGGHDFVPATRDVRYRKARAISQEFHV